MKKLSILLFFAVVAIGYSQKKPNDLKTSNMSLVEVIVAAGMSSPSSSFSDNSFAGDGSFIELSSN